MNHVLVFSGVSTKVKMGKERRDANVHESAKGATTRVSRAEKHAIPS